MQEAEFRLHAVLKTRSVGRLEGVRILSFEKTLHKAAAAHCLKRSPVAEELTGVWNMARALIDKEVEGKKKSSETLKAAISRKMEACTDCDSSFVLDAAYWSSLFGELGEEYLSELLELKMPDQAHPDRCTPAEVLSLCFAILVKIVFKL